MKRLFFAFITIMLACGVSSAQQQAIIKQQAQACAQSFFTGDYNTLLNYTYPKALAHTTKATLIAQIKKQLNEMAANGVSFKSVSIGEPGTIYPASNELHCLVPEFLNMNVKGGYVASTYYLLAISPDKGKSWYFMETVKLSPALKKYWFPHFNPQLVIPAQADPVFHPDSV